VVVEDDVHEPWPSWGLRWASHEVVGDIAQLHGVQQFGGRDVFVAAIG
jgi:hypothetical protein